LSERVPIPPDFIFAVGTQVVTRKPVQASNGKIVHPTGAVGVVVKSPNDRQHAYRIRFTDGMEVAINHEQLVSLADFKKCETADPGSALNHHGLYGRVIFRCVIGSRAFGLETSDSDTDRRGVYLPPADLHWSLQGVPEQLENDMTQEAYWEIRKFIVMALKANPNVLECLYTPQVEFATPLGRELIDMRERFLSKLVYQTFNGYVMSQFKKMQSDIRNQGQVKWKHVMHLIRLLLSGITVLSDHFVPVHVGEHRETLLLIKAGEVNWREVEALRQRLHAEFDAAYEATTLPDRPDYDAANTFLIKARRLATLEELP
jgi:uncharacterized protein